MEYRKSVVLSDGRKVVLEDGDAITLLLISDDRIEDRWEVSYPTGGYGGGSLRLSPTERYLVFSYFSGESEEAFCLLTIEDGRFTSVYNSGYLYGEDASYCFVRDETILIQTLRTGMWYKENVEKDSDGGIYYQFGELNLLDLETCEWSRHRIDVYPTDDWEEEKTDVGTFMFSDLAGSIYHVIVPWGRAAFHAPLESRLVIKCGKNSDCLTNQQV